MSRRTDGQGAMYMSGGEYGEGQEMMDLQQSAPMSKTETRPRAARPARGSRGGSAAGQQVTSLFAPSERPDEPVTAGMPFGPGPGEPAPQQSRSFANTLRKLLPYDQNGAIERLYLTAIRRGW